MWICEVSVIFPRQSPTQCRRSVPSLWQGTHIHKCISCTYPLMPKVLFNKRQPFHDIIEGNTKSKGNILSTTHIGVQETKISFSLRLWYQGVECACWTWNFKRSRYAPGSECEHTHTPQCGPEHWKHTVPSRLLSSYAWYGHDKSTDSGVLLIHQSVLFISPEAAQPTWLCWSDLVQISEIPWTFLYWTELTSKIAAIPGRLRSNHIHYWNLERGSGSNKF